MKKWIIGILLGLSICGTASAEVITTKTLTTTKLSNVEFSFTYDRTTGNLDTLEVRARAFIFDSTGKRAGSYVTEANWGDLPQAQRTQIKPFLLWLSKKINNAAVAEDVEQTLPD